MIKILALDREQTVLAEATHPEEAMLCVDREWQDGDHIEVQTEPGCHLMVRIFSCFATFSRRKRRDSIPVLSAS